MSSEEEALLGRKTQRRGSYPEQIRARVPDLTHVPDALIYAVLAMRAAWRGLGLLAVAATWEGKSVQLDLFIDGLGTQECFYSYREGAIAWLGDARWHFASMRFSEAIEHAATAGKISPNAMLALLDGMGALSQHAPNALAQLEDARANARKGGAKSRIDTNEVTQVARRLLAATPPTAPRELAGKLASRFNCTASYIRKVLQEQGILEKRNKPSA